MDFKNYIKAKMPWTRSIYRKRKAPFNLIHNIIDKPVVILLYHRINNTNYNLFNINVTPDNFDKHIKHLKEQYNVISFEDLKYKSIKEPSVIITFDDGYFDNYKNAFPILKKYNIPATIFVTTSGIDSIKEFWWDRLETIFFKNQKLFDSISFDIFNQTYLFDVSSKLVRQKSFYAAHKLLFNLKPDYRDQILNNFYDKYSLEPNIENRTMSSSELLEIYNSKLITIGAHTINHPALKLLSYNEQYNEIQSSKLFLEKLLGTNIDLFAYPFGHKHSFDKVTEEIVEALGFSFSVSTNRAQVHTNTNCFSLPRFGVENWSEMEFHKQMKLVWFEN